MPLVVNRKCLLEAEHLDPNLEIVAVRDERLQQGGGRQTKQRGVAQNRDEGLRQVKLYPIKLPGRFILCRSPAPEKDEKQANINSSYLSVSSAVSPIRNDCVYSHSVFCEYVALYSLICIQIIQMCCKFFKVGYVYNFNYF